MIVTLDRLAEMIGEALGNAADRIVDVEKRLAALEALHKNPSHNGNDVPGCEGCEEERENPPGSFTAPSAPIEPGEGYRLLMHGEIVENGDEVWAHGKGPWDSDTMVIGFGVTSGMHPIRRRITPAPALITCRDCQGTYPNKAYHNCQSAPLTLEAEKRYVWDKGTTSNLVRTPDGLYCDTHPFLDPYSGKAYTRFGKFHRDQATPHEYDLIREYKEPEKVAEPVPLDKETLRDWFKKAYAPTQEGGPK